MKLNELKKELCAQKLPSRYIIDALLAEGYEKDLTKLNMLRRANGIVNLFLKHEKHVCTDVPFIDLSEEHHKRGGTDKQKA